MSRTVMCKASPEVQNNQIINKLPCKDKYRMDIGPSCSAFDMQQNHKNQSELIADESGCVKNETMFNYPQESLFNNPQENITGSSSIQDVQSILDKLTPLFGGNFEENLISSLRPESKAAVDSLVERIKQLSVLQKMLLYLKLPGSRNDPDEIDPLRKPLNPLGNRMEVSQALAYIKTHFHPDPDISLPKKEIYSEYVSFCLKRKIKPLSTADFGKAMKQVYPVVRPRRLGERGNSRYCYSGLRTRDHLNKPAMPGFPLCQDRESVSKNICNWASRILNVQVENLTELNKIISSDHHSKSSDNYHNQSPSGVPESKVQKRPAEDAAGREEHNDDVPVLTSSKQRKTSISQKSNILQTKSTNSLKRSLEKQSSKKHHGLAGSASSSDISAVCDTNNLKKINVNMDKKDSIDNSDLTKKSTNVEKRIKAISNRKPPVRKSMRTKTNNEASGLFKHENKVSLKMESKVLSNEDNFGITSIEENPSLQLHYSVIDNLSKAIPGERVSIKPVTSSENHRPCEFIDKISVSIDSNETQDCDQTDVGYLSTESLGHYLQDEGNSQEPEEELLKYFKDPVKSEPKECNTVKDISQLRLLLEQNLPEDITMKYQTKTSQDASFCVQILPKSGKIDVKNNLISSRSQLQQPPRKPPTSVLNNTSKRRVSFENIPDSFPQSPNTRTNFSFTPISPRPPTISKPAVNISPFVFPRETVFRGKLSVGGVYPPAPSPVLHHSSAQINSLAQSSPLKNLSRSTSLSSTPSPIINGPTSSSNIVLRGRSTPQDITHEHIDSLKSSPLISPSSSSGVFLSPASPISSCNSPVFTFRKSLSPVKQPDELKTFSKSNSSLLQSLLLTGKCPEINPTDMSEGKPCSLKIKQENETDPLAVDVYQFSEEKASSPFRCQSVPTLTNIVPISPSSNTLPFSLSSLKSKDIPPLTELKQSDLDVWGSVFNGRLNNGDSLLIDGSSDNDTAESDIQTAANEVSMESVISNLCDLLGDKETGENVRLVQPHPSRSHPNTPLLYNESSNSSRDPVVSAFPLSTTSKSYPSTPTVSSSQAAGSTNNSSAKRNIIPLLDNLTSSVPSFSDDIELHLNNFADLSGCDDAFNVLEREVDSTNNFREIQ